jgi:dipeptidyl aminopeptidase/acylaminoacyl peptidase
VTVNNTQTTYFVKGTAGALAKVAVTAPASGLASSTQSVVVSATDQYDNAKGGSVNLLVNTNGVITTATVTTGAGGTVSHVVTLPASGSVTVTAFAASSSATATIAVTQPRNLQAELDKALADLAAEKAAHVATKGSLLTVTTQLVALQAQLDSATALSAKDVRKLKWQYNALVKKYNVGKPKAQKLAFIK